MSEDKRPKILTLDGKAYQPPEVKADLPEDKQDKLALAVLQMAMDMVRRGEVTNVCIVGKRTNGEPFPAIWTTFEPGVDSRLSALDMIGRVELMKEILLDVGHVGVETQEAITSETPDGEEP